MQAEGVERAMHAGNAEATADNRCGPAPSALSGAAMLRHMAVKITLEGVLDANETKFLRGLADDYDARRKRQAAEAEAKARAEVEDRERDADRLLVIEEMSRVAGLDLKGWLHADLVTLAVGHGPEARLTTPLKSVWWRMLVAAARELRRLRQEVRRLRQFVGVEMAATPKPDVDALAERILGVIQSEALRLFTTAADRRDFGPAHVARRIAEELCR